MFHRIIVCILLGTGLLACSQAEEKLSEELQEKVLGLHDNLMPKTEQLVSLQAQLDSFSTGKDSVHVNKLKKALAKSDQAMMDWMHQFSIDSLSKMAAGDKVSYLQAQYSTLTSLKSSTDSSLHAAQTYLSR